MRCRLTEKAIAAGLCLGLLLAIGGCGGPAEAPPEFARAWGTRGSGPGQLESPEGMAADHQGNLVVADTWNHRILKFDPSGKQILAFGSLGEEPGQFQAPRAVAVDGKDNIYVADTWNHRVQKFSPEGDLLLEFGGLAVPFLGVAPTGLLNYPSGIAVDSQGQIFVTDFNLSRCQMFDPEGEFLLAWGTAGRQDGQFQIVAGVAVDKDDVVYIVDSNNARIQKFELKGILPPPPVMEAETLTREVSNGEAEVSEQALTPAWGGNAALVFKPKQLPATLTLKLEVKHSGKYEIFVSLDRGPSQGLASLSVDGEGQGRHFDGWATKRVGSEKTSFGQRSFSKGEHQLEFQVTGKNKRSEGMELTLDSLQLVSTTKERFLGKWGREGKELGQMLRPRGICFDGEGALYVADTGNHRVLKYSTTGKLLAAWGKQGEGKGEFESPHDVAGRKGAVSVLDWGNNRVESFSF